MVVWVEREASGAGTVIGMGMALSVCVWGVGYSGWGSWGGVMDLDTPFGTCIPFMKRL